jgi:hypothetical protein
MKYRASLIIICVALVAVNAVARLISSKDPLDSVLDAQLVVIVRPWPVEKAQLFKIEEVFLGDKKKGDVIDLGDIQLQTIQEYGPPVVEPITADTRLLLFLQRKDESAMQWEATYYQQFFWVQRPQDSFILRRAAERAIDVRKQWLAAVNLSDPTLRVASLWPFLNLQEDGVKFFQRTQVELQKARPASGLYFAEKFDAMSHNDRMLMLAGAGLYGSEQLHRKLKNHLNELRTRFEEFVEQSGKSARDINWNAVPEDIKDVEGELYYGLAGLAKFMDRTDLPYIRDAGVWAAKYHLEQMADAAVDAFREMPDAANLQTFDAMLKEFMPGRQPGMWSIDIDAERSLCKHNYPATIPLLAPFLADDFMGSEVEDCLTEIIGRDLGRNPMAWTDWYKASTKQAIPKSPSR